MSPKKVLQMATVSLNFYASLVLSEKVLPSPISLSVLKNGKPGICLRVMKPPRKVMSVIVEGRYLVSI